MFPLNLEEQFLSSGDIMAYDMKSYKGHHEEDSKQGAPHSARERNGLAVDNSVDRGSRVGSMTSRDSAVGTPRIGTLASEGGPLASPGAPKEQPPPQGRGVNELREQGNATNPSKPKKQLKEFYEAVLDKDNQKFLYSLVKQSCIS